MNFRLSFQPKEFNNFSLVQSFIVLNLMGFVSHTQVESKSVIQETLDPVNNLQKLPLIQLF